MRVRRALFALPLLFLGGGQAPARVLDTSLCELTAVADFIVIATTQDIVEVDGVRLARAKVTETIKGDLTGEFYFLAQGTWTCDISWGEKGEADLLFLSKHQYEKHHESHNESGLQIIGVFDEPPRFKSKVSRATGSSRLLEVAWSGRGQMPLRTIDNEPYVTIWTEDVQLPARVETVDGPEAEYADFIRSAPSDEILHLVRRYLKTCGGQR